MPLETLGLVLLSSLLHAAWTASIKGSRDPLAFNLLQAVPFVPIVAGMLLVVDLSAVPARAWQMFAASSVVHAAYVYWLSRALETTDFSVAYPIMRSTPAFLPLVAVPLLGERVSLVGALGIGVVVAGMWLVHTRGSFRLANFVQPGTGFAYLVLLSTVAYSLTDKAAMVALTGNGWSQPVPASLLYFYGIGVGYAVCMAPFALRRTSLRDLATVGRREWRAILAAGAGSAASYSLILEAFRSAPASYVVTVRQASVLFAVAIAAFWFREAPGRARVAGALLTVLGVALVSLA